MRNLLGLLATILFTASLMAADNPPSADRAAAIKTIKDDAKKASILFETKLETVTSNREAELLEKAYITKMKALLDDAVKLFKDLPTDEPAADAAFFVFASGTAEQITAAGEQILKNNIADKRVRSAIATASEYGEHTLHFLKEVAKRSPDKENQAFSYFVIGRNYAEQSESTDVAEVSQKAAKIAEGYYALAAETNGEMKLGEKVTMAKAVKEELYSLQNLGLGKVAPDFEGLGFDGSKTKLSSYRGKVVVLDFWKTTCPPCLAMIPMNREIVKSMEGRPFVFVGINLDENKAIGKRFVEERNLNWPQWWSKDDADAADAYRIQKYPSVFVIDAKGVIRYKMSNPRTLTARIEELVKEAEAKK